MIDKLKYQLNSKQYSKELFEKNKIIIGNTYTGDMSHHKGWTLRNNGKFNQVSTYSIDKSGEIYQHFHPKFWSKFTNSDIDQNAISIAIVNEGWLIPNGEEYYNLNNTIFSGEPINKYWRGYDFWAPYSEPQYKALRLLILKLTKEFKIPLVITPHTTAIKNPKLVNGVLCRSNISKAYSDLSPLFDFNKIKTQ